MFLHTLFVVLCLVVLTASPAGPEWFPDDPGLFRRTVLCHPLHRDLLRIPPGAVTMASHDVHIT